MTQSFWRLSVGCHYRSYYSKGSFTSGIAFLAGCADQYLCKTQKESTVNEAETEDSQENPNSPIAKTPANVSQKAFTHFFDSDYLFNKEDMQHEMLKLNFKKLIWSSNNYKVISTIKSTASFGIRNATKYPLLSKQHLVLVLNALAKIYLHVDAQI